MSDPAIISSFLEPAWDWAWRNKETVGAVIIAFAGAFAWVWKNWIRPKRDKGVSQTQTGGLNNNQIGPVSGPVTINQSGSGDLAAIAKILVEEAGARARAETRLEYEPLLAEKDQQVRDLTAALTKAQSIPSPPLVNAADGGAITPANARTLALASEATLQAYLESKKAEGISANREAATVARHIGALVFLHDTQKALRFYREATELNPDDPEAWNQRGHLLHRIGDLANAEKSYERVLQLANTIVNQSLLPVAYGNLGNVYQTRGDLTKAEEFYKKSLALNEKLGGKEGMANAYGNLGTVYQARGDLAKAEEFYKKALAIDEALGRKEGMAYHYGNLGNVYQMRGDLAKAEELYKKVLAITEGLSHKVGVAITYGNLGSVYRTLGDLAKAEEFYKKALALNEDLGCKAGMASNYGNFGNVYATRGDLAKAEAFFKKSLALNEELGRKEGMASQHNNLGCVYQTRGDLNMACEAWTTSRRLFTELGNRTLADQVDGCMRDAGCPTP